MELKLYRHKNYKDIYLVRESCVCGGGENTQFYRATKIMGAYEYAADEIAAKI